MTEPASDSAGLGRAWLAALDRELSAGRELRHRLHAQPRVSGQEHDTAALIAEQLPGSDLLLDGTAVACRLGPPGPAVMLRSELDALPVQERTDVEWRSRTGAMHACGHDLHSAALVAVCRAAAGLDLPVGLLAVFQPREEAYPSGAADLVDSGFFTDRPCLAGVAAHVHPGVRPGTVAAAPGLVNAAADELGIEVTGVGGHGAYPHLAADVVAPTAQLLLALPELVRRTVDPVIGALISVGTVQIGHGSANVLPDRASVRATLRTTVEDDRLRVEQAVRDLVEQLCAGFGVRGHLTVTRGEPVLRNDDRLAAALDRRLPGVGLSPAPAMRSLGADDFSFFGAVMPTLMCFVGVHTDGLPSDAQPALHDARFLPAEEYLATVARTQVAGYLAAVESRDQLR